MAGNLRMAAFTAAFVIGGLGCASAADMAVKARPLPMPVDIWTGYYFGGNVGGVWTDDHTDFGGDPAGTVPAIARGQLPGTLSTSSAGVIGGLQVGYNKQVGQFVWGLEADWQGSSLNRSSSFSSSVPGFFPALTTTQEKLDFLGTVRGRIGWTASPAVLLYATGGLAYGDPSLSTSVNTFPAVVGVGNCAGFCSAVSTTDWRAGWTAGAGAEWKFRGPWSAKLEYLYYDLGRSSQTGTDTLGRFPSTFYTASGRFTGNIVRVGVNYAFGAGPAVFSH